jgi:signal transduction histidine kinase
MLETPADPAVFLNRLRVSRRALVRGVLLARLVVLAMLLTLPEQRDLVRHHPVAVALTWSALAAYLIGGVFAADRIADLLEAHPGAVWIDVAVCVLLVVIGAGGRLAFYYLAAAPVVVAAVLGSLVLAVAVATVQTVVEAPVFLLGLQPGMEQAHSTERAPGLVGLFVAVGLFAIVRSLFDQLEEAGLAYRDSATATAAAVREEAAAEQRGTVMAGLNARLGDLLRELCADADRLRRFREEDAEWSAQTAEVERIARDAASRLRQAVDQEPVGATVQEAIVQARRRVAELGADRVELELDSCGGLALGTAESAALTRFVEEAVTNAWKHGQPPVVVRASSRGRAVVLCVSDAGGGFAPEAAERSRGLRSLAHDAGTLGGRLGFARAGDAGTTVQLEFEARDA